MKTRSPVLLTPPASAVDALAHFSALLTFETDCWDVHASLQRDEPGFVLLDVRSRDLFERGHIAGAVHVAHRRITAERLAGHAPDTLFVTYCAGPHCNGAAKAARRLARLGRPVKLMIGGIEGWKDEGFSLTTASAARASCAS